MEIIAVVNKNLRRKEYKQKCEYDWLGKKKKKKKTVSHDHLRLLWNRNGLDVVRSAGSLTSDGVSVSLSDYTSVGAILENSNVKVQTSFKG